MRYSVDDNNYCDFTFTPSEGSFDITAAANGELDCSVNNVMNNLKISPLKQEG